MNLDPPPIWPTINACLNALAAFSLVRGYRFVKRGNIRKHRRWMTAAFTASVLFMISYILYHHQLGGRKTYSGPHALRVCYMAILITHSIGAAVVPPAALWALIQGLRHNIRRHVQTTRWLWPLWMYVSVTGVVIYIMLYWL